MQPTYGNWKIVREIGRGSFGVVYEIAREEYGYTYHAALKVITIPQERSEVDQIRSQGLSEADVTEYYKGIVEDCVREIAMMSQMQGHTNIVNYQNHEVQPHTDGFGWDILIQMELLTSLSKYTASHVITLRDVVNVGIGVCHALERCQKLHIIHRDIKPDNIFVSDQGDFKLGDFGIARTAERTMSGMSRKGTYTYMAPEIYSGKAYSDSVDLYSLGLVLYRLLNNNRGPFMPPYPDKIQYKDQEQALIRRMQGEPLPMPGKDQGRLAEIVLKACSFDPKDRYASPKEMREELEALLKDEEEHKKAAAIELEEQLDDQPADEEGKQPEEKTEPTTPHSEETPQEAAEDGPVTPFDQTAKDETEEETVFLSEKADEPAEEVAASDQEETPKEDTEEGTISLFDKPGEEETVFLPEKKDKTAEEVVASDQEETPKEDTDEGTISLFDKTGEVVSEEETVFLSEKADEPAEDVVSSDQEETPKADTEDGTISLFDKTGEIASEEETVFLWDEKDKSAEEQEELQEEDTQDVQRTEEEDGVAEQPKSWKKKVLIACAAVLVLVCGYFGFYRLTTVAVPDVMNLSIAEAEELFKENGLILEEGKSVYSEEADKGKIASCEREGKRAKKGAVLSVAVSLGKQTEVKDYTGKQADKVKKSLTKRGITVKEKKQYSLKYDKGVIVKQSSEKGAKLAEGDTMTLTVSKGPKPVKLEQFTGMSQKDAVQKAEKLGLKVKTSEAFSSIAQKGNVAEQSPKAGETVQEGDTITFTISKGAEQVKVPNLMGKTRAEAESALKAAGLSVGSVTTSYSSYAYGNVCGQGKTAGSQTDKGSAVNFTISVGAKPVYTPKYTPKSSYTPKKSSGSTKKKKNKKKSDTVVVNDKDVDWW